MRHFLLLTLFYASAASAQSPELEQACAKVAKDFNLTSTLTLGVVQSFPDLTPPGVRMTYSTQKDAKSEDITDQMECEFKNNKPPFELQSFCISRTCYSPDSKDPAERRRFAEVKSLMDRAPK